jgi:hypothetical protein
MKESPGSAAGASGARATRLLIGMQVGGFLLLACYSALLMMTEFRNSQDYVRPFFTDIRGPVFLYAINTTLATTLMWCTAMLFLVCFLIVADQTVSGALVGSSHRRSSSSCIGGDRRARAGARGLAAFDRGSQQDVELCISFSVRDVDLHPPDRPIEGSRAAARGWSRTSWSGPGPGTSIDTPAPECGNGVIF